MARPNWEYIRVDVLLPDHPKLDALSDKAFRTLIELWCWCGQNRTDGFVRDAKWKAFGSAAARTALVRAGLAERVTGGYQMHDFTGPDGHQRSRAEIEELSAKRSASGRKGGHAKANGKHLPEQTPGHVPKQTAGKSVAEAEAEAEATTSLADVDHQSADRNAHDLTRLIITEIRTATGRTVTAEWASKIRAHILDGRSPADPAAYVRQVIRNEPSPRTRFLPVY